jgi:hypothetical protein
VPQVFIGAQKKLFYLQQIIDGAVASRSKVIEALQSFQSQLNTASFQKGRILISTSGNGQSAGFEMNLSGREVTPDNVAAMSVEFRQILRSTLCNNPSLADDGTPANTQAIGEAMECDDRLYGCTRRGSDFTLLGFPQVGQLGGPA